MDYETNSSVRRLHVEEVPVRAKPVRTEPQSISGTGSPEPKTHDAMIAAFSGLGYALSARALLLLTLVGAFVLAVMAMQSQTNPALAVLIAYCLLTVVPVSYLEIMRRKQG